MWGQCSASCGKGKKTRSRTCKPPECGGKECEGKLSDEADCDNGDCPENCEWSFDEWSDCTPDCGNGTRTRTSKCTCLTKETCTNCKCNETAKPTPESETCTNQKPCPQDCEASTWSTWSDCVYKVNCSDGEKTRKRTVTKPKVGDGKNCPDLEETERCPKQCEECVPPRKKMTCTDPCDKTCQHARQSVACTNVKKCVEDCKCPPGMYEHENGTCVPKNDCGCEWDVKQFGPKPADSPQYYPDGYVLKKDKCNNCTCKGYQWSCSAETCDIDCKWGDWEKDGPCSVNCGSGIQKWKREIKINKKGDGSDCVGNKTKEDKCKERDCPCEDEEEWSETDQCEDTCTNRLNQTYAGKSADCVNKCKCKRSEGYYRQGKKCVKSNVCTQCVVNGTVYEDNQYLPKKPGDPCKRERCKNSLVVEEEDCNTDKTCADNEVKVLVPGTKCCYECKPPPLCGPKPQVTIVNLRTFLSAAGLLNDVPCVFNASQTITIQECSGTCQGKRSATPVEWSAPNGDFKSISGDLRACKCCEPSYASNKVSVTLD